MSRAIRGSAGVAIAAAAAVGLVGAAVPAASSAPRLHAAVAKTPHISIHATKSAFTVSGPKTFRAGRVAISLTASGDETEVDVISLKAGYSFADFTKDVTTFGLSEQSSTGPSAAGIAALDNAVAHVTTYGGLDVEKGKTGKGTITLAHAGTYYVYNDSGIPSSPHKLTVTGPKQKRASVHSDGTVIAKTGERFGGDAVLPHKGTITFKNEATDKTPHFLDLSRVKKGTTRADVLKYFESGSQAQPSFSLSGEVDSDSISPGHSETLTYSLPKGTYVELCFFPDLKTGMPHALMGMIRIVTLK